MDPMNELAFYTLAGAPKSPRDLIAEVQQAEALGIGSAFISERFNIKEAATLSGAAGAVSARPCTPAGSGGGAVDQKPAGPEPTPAPTPAPK